MQTVLRISEPAGGDRPTLYLKIENPPCSREPSPTCWRSDLGAEHFLIAFTDKSIRD